MSDELEDRGTFTCRGGPMEGRTIGVSGLLCAFFMTEGDWRHRYEPNLLTMEFVLCESTFSP